MSVNQKRLFNFVEDKYGNIYDEAKELAQSVEYGSDISSAARNIVKVFEVIEEEYYGNLEKGVDPDAHEHIFGGDKYLVILGKEFATEFTYENNEWVLR